MTMPYIKAIMCKIFETSFESLLQVGLNLNLSIIIVLMHLFYIGVVLFAAFL